MRKNAIIQIYIGEMSKLVEYSCILARAYAKRISADYEFVTAAPAYMMEQYLRRSRVSFFYSIWSSRRIHILQPMYHPSIFKIILFLDDKFIKEYDNILFLDSDMLPWPTLSENIFDLAPEDSFTVVRNSNSYANESWRKNLVTRAKRYGISENNMINIDKYFNEGLFILNKYSFQIFSEHLSKNDWRIYKTDAHFFSDVCFRKSIGIRLHELDVRYNVCVEDENTKYASNHYITHLLFAKRRSELIDVWLSYAKPFVESVKD